MQRPASGRPDSKHAARKLLSHDLGHAAPWSEGPGGPPGFGSPHMGRLIWKHHIKSQTCLSQTGNILCHHHPFFPFTSNQYKLGAAPGSSSSGRGTEAGGSYCMRQSPPRRIKSGLGVRGQLTDSSSSLLRFPRWRSGRVCLPMQET